MKHLYQVFILSLMISCSTSVKDVDGTILRVNHYTVDCVGEMQGKCLLVQEGEMIGTEDWEYFYYEDSIIGFEYEPGYIYQIVVKKTKVPNPPQDASSIKYVLLRIISKEKF